MGAVLVRSAVGLLVLTAAFGVAQRLWPAVRLPSRRKGELVTDLLWWVVTPQVTRVITKIAVVLVAGAWAVIITRQTDPSALVTAFSSRSPIGAQPLWLQAVAVVVLGDLLGYWTHRAFHAGSWWRFHAVHHSAERLDWLSSTRVHPVNDLVGGLVRVLPLFLLGFRLEVLAGYLPGLALHGILLHANVRWSFGPLRYVIASPAFHRWHHAAEAEGRDKNFAGLLPVWDLIFGTFYMPGRPPERCGVEERVPVGFVGQLAYPWREGHPGRKAAARGMTKAGVRAETSDAQNAPKATTPI